MSNTVESMYDANPLYEWQRLERHPMEYETTMRAMDEYIRPNSRILDIGGGPGRYSIALAKRGHKVTLLDLAESHIQLAREKAVESGVSLEGYIKGNALDLSAVNSQRYDVVLVMGPLYHLLDEEERAKAIKEALQVLNPGGIIIASFITRYAFIIDWLAKGAESVPDFINDRLQSQLLQTGKHLVSEHKGFTDAYFIHPYEIEPLMSGFGLTTLRLAAAEGVLGASEGHLRGVSSESFSRWVDICYSLGTDPSIWGTASHMLYVGSLTKLVG